MEVQVETTTGGVRFPVQAQPRASRTGSAGAHGGAVRIRLAAPPVEGAANDELVAFLSKALGVPRSAVRIVRGARGRRKLVEVEGIGAEAVRRALL
jgi:uncharacterized protein (TIGR00251 family)